MALCHFQCSSSFQHPCQFLKPFSMPTLVHVILNCFHSWLLQTLFHLVSRMLFLKHISFLAACVYPPLLKPKASHLALPRRFLIWSYVHLPRSHAVPAIPLCTSFRSLNNPSPLHLTPSCSLSLDHTSLVNLSWSLCLILKIYVSLKTSLILPLLLQNTAEYHGKCLYSTLHYSS